MTGPTDRRGLVACPWGCGELVRLTVNNNAKKIHVDPEPDHRGLIAAHWTGDRWRSRQLHKGETVQSFELVFVIHNATCSLLGGRPPQPKPPPPAPGPIPKHLAETTRAVLDAVRRTGPDRRKGGD